MGPHVATAGRKTGMGRTKASGTGAGAGVGAWREDLRKSA